MRAIRCLVAAVLAAGIVTVVAAKQPGGFGGQQDVNALVLTNAALQEDIKVTDDQKKKFKTVADKQTEMQKAFTDLFAKGFKDIDKDKITELNEKRTKIAEESKKVVEDTLTADQKKRLKQITIQVMAFQVFNDPEAKTKGKFGGATDAQKAIMKEVGEALKLTDKQKSSIKGVSDDFAKESRDIRTEAFSGGFDAEKNEAANKKIDKLRKDAWTKVEGELDGTQKTAWKGLVGEPFDTAKLRPAPMPKKD